MITAPRIISLLLALLACVPAGQGGLTAAGSISNAWDMPPLDLQDPEGQRHTLHDWHGKVILLNFWASWCGPCQAEVPDLVRYQREYAGQGLQVIGVGLDELSRIRNFIRTFGITYPVLVSDPSRGHELLPRWGDPRQILPFTVVIGRDGHIHFMQVGPLGEEAFADYVLPLLNAPPPGRQHEYTHSQITSETQLSGVGRWNGDCRACPQRFRVGWEPGAARPSAAGMRQSSYREVFTACLDVLVPSPPFSTMAEFQR